MHLKLLVGDEVRVLPRHQQAAWVNKDSLSFSVEIAKNKHLPSSLLALDENTISGRTGSIPNLEFASFPLENAKTTALDFWHFLHTRPLHLHLELLQDFRLFMLICPFTTSLVTVICHQTLFHGQKSSILLESFVKRIEGAYRASGVLTAHSRTCGAAEWQPLCCWVNAHKETNQLPKTGRFTSSRASPTVCRSLYWKKGTRDFLTVAKSFID